MSKRNQCVRCGWTGTKLLYHRFCPDCRHPFWNYEAGQKIGPYTLERVLGVGGFAEVWLAVHRQLDVRRALKRLRMEELLLHWQPKSVQEFQQRFVREARVQAQLNHPNIVQVFELAEWEHEIWMIMEYCSGGNLLQYMQKQRLELNVAIEIALQILKGLAFAHRHGVIHRDIKPSNILRSEDGTWKIGDFGIAKVATDMNLTQSGSRMGTPYYMAPEQWKDPKSVGPESDIYGVGCMLYQMVEGVVPFPGESMAEVMEKHMKEKPPPMKHAPEWLETVLLKAMSKQPHNRFRNAGAMMEALTAAKRLDITTARAEAAETTLVLMPVETVQRHSSWVTSVAFHPDQALLATASNDWTVALYDLDRRTFVHHFQSFYSPVLTVRFHPDGNILAAGELKGQITLIHTETGQVLRRFPSTAATTSLDFSPSGRFLVSGHFNGRVILWNLDFGVPAFDQLQHTREIRGVASAPTDDRWVSISEDGQIVFWELKTGEILKSLRSVSGQPEAVAWHPQGRYVAVATASGVIDIWDTQYWQVAYSFHHGDSSVIALAFDPEGQYLASSGADGNIIIWVSPTGVPVAKVSAHQGPVLCLAFHRKGKWLASGGIDSLARIWSLSHQTLSETTKTRTRKKSRSKQSERAGA